MIDFALWFGDESGLVPEINVQFPLRTTASVPDPQEQELHQRKQGIFEWFEVSLLFPFFIYF
jgi:hypothetical protein